MKAERNVGRVLGTRIELMTELGRLRDGWLHFGDETLASESALGLTDLARGASSVRVGHTVYEVTEATHGGSLQ